VPEQTNYDPDWDKPETVTAFLTKHPPTLIAVARWLEDAAEATHSPLHRAWYLRAAQIVKKSTPGD
jgi:hypothetical protein